jgi:hypothetical protein
MPLLQNLGGQLATGQGNQMGSTLASAGINQALKWGGNLLGDLFGSIGIFKDGGTVGCETYPTQSFSQGGVAGRNVAGYDSRAIDAALKAEGGSGAGAMLAVVHRGEPVLSDRTGDAQLFNSMMDSGEWADRKSGSKNVPHYLNGNVGQAITRNRSNDSGSKKSTHNGNIDQSTHIHIDGGDNVAEAFSRNQEQIALRVARKRAQEQSYSG